MQDWRVAQFDALEKKVIDKASDFGQDVTGAGAPRMQRTGTPSFASDVDVSFLGPSATAHRNAAIRIMEQDYGPGWRKILDADIFSDPSRMHLFEDPLKKLGGKGAKEAEKRIVKESELNVLAKMLKDGADLQTVAKMAKEIGVDMAEVTGRQKELSKLSVDYLAGMLKRGTPEDEVKKLANEMGVDMADVTKHVQGGEDLYRQLELKMDVLHKRFIEAEGDVSKQAAIAEEMAAIQGKLNAAIPGPYMTPGGTAKHVSRRERALRPGDQYVPMSPAMGYTAVLDDLYMLTHSLEGVAEKGFTEKSAKSMAKYSDRLLTTAGQFGVDMAGKTTRPLFETIEGLLSRARLEKDKPALETAIQLLEQAKGSLENQLGTIVVTVKKNADEYLSTLSAAERSGVNVSEWVKKATNVLTRERDMVDGIRIATKEYIKERQAQE